jgi:hypothetical protein
MKGILLCLVGGIITGFAIKDLSLGEQLLALLGAVIAMIGIAVI